MTVQTDTPSHPDRIIVTAKNHRLHGRTGTIIPNNARLCLIHLDTGGKVYLRTNQITKIPCG